MLDVSTRTRAPKFGGMFRYGTEDARMRGIVLASTAVRAAPDEAERVLQDRFGCSRGDAWRAVHFRAIASLDVLSAFTDPVRCITWRQAWRIASTWPYEAEIQNMALRAYRRSRTG